LRRWRYILVVLAAVLFFCDLTYLYFKTRPAETELQIKLTSLALIYDASALLEVSHLDQKGVWRLPNGEPSDPLYGLKFTPPNPEPPHYGALRIGLRQHSRFEDFLRTSKALAEMGICQFFILDGGVAAGDRFDAAAIVIDEFVDERGQRQKCKMSGVVRPSILPPRE
jgi:hypothetical protein